MKDTFSLKTRKAMFDASHGFCQCSTECMEKATDFHHRFPNTKVNRKKYPLFIQSPMNCQCLGRHCHQYARHISEDLVQVYEEYLNSLTGGAK